MGMSPRTASLQCPGRLTRSPIKYGDRWQTSSEDGYQLVALATRCPRTANTAPAGSRSGSGSGSDSGTRDPAKASRTRQQADSFFSQSGDRSFTFTLTADSWRATPSSLNASLWLRRHQPSRARCRLVCIQHNDQLQAPWHDHRCTNLGPSHSLRHGATLPKPGRHETVASATSSTLLYATNGDSRSITLQSRPSVNHSLSASSRDLAMADAPSQTPPPRAYTAASLSAADLQQVTELTSYLVENSYSYESHVKLINILHRGLLSHVYPDHADEPGGNPLDYSLLPDLRQARDAMESRFAVGELLWIDWIRDECMIARSPEERVAAQELCQRALVDEPASVTLHELYAEWMWTIYAAANDLPGWTDVDLGTDEDKMILRELFNRDLVYGIWDNAVAATSWRIDAGHRIWKRYLEIIMQGFP
ncbi:hypothetical protein LTR28_004970, partial [Elasticomyces elasticus]